LEPGNGRFKIIGDPTESALLALGVSFFGPEKIQSISRNTPVESIPFDSTNKFMATLHELQLSQFAEIFSSSERESENAEGKCRVVFVKGAPEKIIDFCATSEEAKAVWKAQAMRMGEQGMRVLGCAYKVVSPSVQLTIELISDLNMSCLVGIADPPREEAIHAIQSAHNAGITVKMITGDHPVTARTIGRQLGLLPGTHTAVTGADLDALIANNDLATFDQIVRNNNIFARTSPEHKLLIVQSLQRQNISCSMTGDGVNDAPALKQANIGVAMGITGTEVAKDASHIIITDDNFATIVEAIRYGRCTYDNLVKILVFVLPTNAAQAFSIIMALIIGVEVPLTALQILWVNMITSVTLGLILAFERPNEQIMQSAPRRSGKSIFGKFLSWRVVFVSTLLVVAVLGNFHWEKQRIGSLDKLRTISVNTLSVGQLFYLFNCRNLKHNESPLKLLVGNRALLFGLMGVALAQGLFTYSTFFHYLFRTESLDLLSWGKMVLLGAVIFIILELEKAATKLWNHLRGSGGHQLVVMENDSSTAVATAADDAMQQI
jgi:magnesium-transporting ATPase (P-type)